MDRSAKGNRLGLPGPKSPEEADPVVCETFWLGLTSRLGLTVRKHVVQRDGFAISDFAPDGLGQMIPLLLVCGGEFCRPDLVVRKLRKDATGHGILLRNRQFLDLRNRLLK